MNERVEIVDIEHDDNKLTPVVIIRYVLMGIIIVLMLYIIFGNTCPTFDCSVCQSCEKLVVTTGSILG